MSCVGEIKEYRSNLRCIMVSKLGKLREVWRMKDGSSSDILIRSFQAVERIDIDWCESFVNVFTPTATNSDVRTLMNVSIDGRRPWEESGRNIELVQKSQEINVIPMAEISEVYCEFSVRPIPNHLEVLKVRGCKDVEVVFEIESSSSSSRELSTTTPHNHQPLLLPYLKELDLCNMEKMSEVWKCNWKKLVIPQNQSQSSFHSLTTIHMRNCPSIKYLFSPLMGTLLPNLKGVHISNCAGIGEVVSNRSYDENDEMSATSIYTHTDTISFPRLDYLHLWNLPCLKSIDGGTAITTTSNHDQLKCSEAGVGSWLLSQHSKKIDIWNCDALSRVFPSYAVGRLHKLEELRISGCKSMVEVFESEGITIPRSANKTLLQLPSLTKLQIYDCEALEYIFTSSTLESLKQLKDLSVIECKAMQVIVKEDTETSQTIVFPRLKSLTLADLPDLKGFFLGMNRFEWKLLEKVTMYGCPQMMLFTCGHSMAPKLNHIQTALGKHSLECGLNFHLTNETQLRMSSPPPDDMMIKLLQFPCSFSNLVEVDEAYLDSRVMFPCNELLNLKNLEKLYIYRSRIEEAFEVVEGTDDDDVNETQSSSSSSVVVVIEKLEEVTLLDLYRLKHMWKSNGRIVLNFPNLTKVSIEGCELLGHVFTSCMVGSLLQLQELQISDCRNMDVIVKHVEEDSETEVVFPCLKSITLDRLPNLKGFCLGKTTDFVWPSLETLELKGCPQIEVFTGGQSTAPKLELIDTTFGMCHATQDPNSFIKTKQQEGWQF